MKNKIVATLEEKKEAAGVAAFKIALTIAVVVFAFGAYFSYRRGILDNGFLQLGLLIGFFLKGAISFWLLKMRFYKRLSRRPQISLSENPEDPMETRPLKPESDPHLLDIYGEKGPTMGKILSINGQAGDKSGPQRA